MKIAGSGRRKPEWKPYCKMTGKMKIALLQTDIVWADPEKNRDKAERLIGKAAGADLYVLPEMFSTGFCTEPEGIAEEAPSATLGWMRKTAMDKGCALAGSIAMHTEGAFRNRFCFVHPDGKTDFYDKRHLFSYGDEHREFTAGNSRVITEFRGTRILLQICYDLRFPVWARNREDYDLAIYVANWPVTRIEAWKTLLRARAIENQCYVCGVNRAGTDPYNTYSGASALIGPNGNTIVSCEDTADAAITADIDLDLLERFRNTFPVLKDADEFTIRT